MMLRLLVTFANVAARTIEPIRTRFTHRMARAVPMSNFSGAERRFLEDVARVLLPPAAAAGTDIDVVVNIEHMLTQASADHRERVVQLVRWSRRLSWVYGGTRMPLRARRSRFVLIQKLAYALSALCLVAFWGDEGALRMAEQPPARP